MSTRKRRGGRRHDATGRSTNERFVWLKHWLLNSPAWKSMKPIPRALYVALRKRFNGTNNGQISISVREAATEIRCAKDSAMRALWELEEKGFIKCSQRGDFNWKLKLASTWILTEESHGGEFATKDFMRWKEKEKSGPKPRTHRSQKKDDIAAEGREIVADSPKTRTVKL